MRRDAAARRAIEEADLDQERLVDLLDRVRLFGERRRPSCSRRPARPELLDDGEQQLAVDLVEAVIVDLEHLQRVVRDVGCDVARPRAPARSRAPGAAGGWRCAACRGERRGDLDARLLVDLNAEDLAPSVAG